MRGNLPTYIKVSDWKTQIELSQSPEKSRISLNATCRQPHVCMFLPDQSLFSVCISKIRANSLQEFFPMSANWSRADMWFEAHSYITICISICANTKPPRIQTDPNSAHTLMPFPPTFLQTPMPMRFPLGNACSTLETNYSLDSLVESLALLELEVEEEELSATSSHGPTFGQHTLQ